MCKYELLNYNGYPLVKINEHLFLIDSGCPLSILFNKVNVSINDVDCNNYFMLAAAHLSSHDMINAFGQSIDGFIGCNILKKFGVLEIDLLNNTVIFGSSNKPKNNLGKLNNFKTNVILNGKQANAYLDTGAHIVMVQNKELLNDAKLIGKHTEESNTGVFLLNMYNSILEISGVSKEIEVLEHNGMMPKMPGVDLYFGLNQIASEYYVLDLINNMFYFK